MAENYDLFTYHVFSPGITMLMRCAFGFLFISLVLFWIGSLNTVSKWGKKG